VQPAATAARAAAAQLLPDPRPMLAFLAVAGALAFALARYRQTVD
jgi:hypothetical protein